MYDLNSGDILSDYSRTSPSVGKKNGKKYNAGGGLSLKYNGIWTHTPDSAKGYKNNKYYKRKNRSKMNRKY